jgi:hypothetical protein
LIAEIAALLLGLSLTVSVLSYAYRDNLVYRLAIHLLVGSGAAYGALVIARSVLVPMVEGVLRDPIAGAIRWLPGLVLAALMMLKIARRTARLGNSAMAFLMAAGVAVAATGAVRGTLLPMVEGPREGAGGALGLAAAALSALALISFWYTGRIVIAGREWTAPRLIQALRPPGQAVIVVALAGLFVAALNTGLTLLSHIVGKYWTAVLALIGELGT